MKERHAYLPPKSQQNFFQNGGCFGLQINLSRDLVVQESTQHNQYTVSKFVQTFLNSSGKMVPYIFTKKEIWTSFVNFILPLTVEIIFLEYILHEYHDCLVCHYAIIYGINAIYVNGSIESLPRNGNCDSSYAKMAKMRIQHNNSHFVFDFVDWI